MTRAQAPDQQTVRRLRRRLRRLEQALRRFGHGQRLTPWQRVELLVLLDGPPECRPAMVTADEQRLLTAYRAVTALADKRFITRTAALFARNQEAHERHR